MNSLRGEQMAVTLTWGERTEDAGPSRFAGTTSQRPRLRHNGPD
ncbi:hypothetical protein [Nocardia amamiensis]|nr:hypothetical protein [Nocardia amamiensis]